MSFKQINIKEELEKQKKISSSFKKEWDESRDEYRLIGEVIQLRKQNGITQTSLADKIGVKQQVISRLEKKENSPSLNFFCKLLDALGYELHIQKK